MGVTKWCNAQAGVREVLCRTCCSVLRKAVQGVLRFWFEGSPGVEAVACIDSLGISRFGTPG